MNKELDYKEEIEITDKSHTHFSNKQFDNRLFDRDTLLICHYDVNFLYVVSLYARNNTLQKDAWKEKVRDMFRTEIQRILEEKFNFYAMSAHPNVDAEAYIKTHFQEVLGKIYTPYTDKGIFSLALDKEFEEDNEALLDTLRKHFYVEPCAIGDDPTTTMQQAMEKGVGEKPGESEEKNVLTGLVRRTDNDFSVFMNHEAKTYTMERIPTINLMNVRYFLPMVAGFIDGYYEVEKLYIGTFRKDGGTLPCLKLKLGKYTRIGNNWINIYRIKMQPGELISMNDTIKLYEE